MWIIIFLLVFILAVSGIIYIVKRFRSFSFIKKISEKHRILSWIIAAVPLILSCGFLYFGFFALLVVWLHLAFSMLICDFFSIIISKIRRKKSEKYFAGIIAVIMTVGWLSYGWYSAHHIVRTEYQLTAQKSLGQESLRIALIADSHIGVTLDGEEFAEQMKRIEKEKPDLLVVAGDFVDDASKKEDMVIACKALDINTTYGTYFSYGNHDEGYSGYRDFSIDDLENELRKNNITVLNDESILVNDSFYIIGRKDRGEEKRKSMSELTADLDMNKYTIVIDHQPNSYNEEADSEVDLVLSGHTHGGQIFPAGQIGMMIGANDKLYGKSKRKSDKIVSNGIGSNNMLYGNISEYKTDFIVTSGISGWEIPFKTLAVSEYVIIDIKQ